MQSKYFWPILEPPIISIMDAIPKNEYTVQGFRLWLFEFEVKAYFFRPKSTRYIFPEYMTANVYIAFAKTFRIDTSLD